MTALWQLWFSFLILGFSVGNTLNSVVIINDYSELLNSKVAQSVIAHMQWGGGFERGRMSHYAIIGQHDHAIMIDKQWGGVRGVKYHRL